MVSVKERQMAENLKSMVLAYFAAVDGERLGDVLELLSKDCAFSVETHGVRLVGHTQIKGMLERLWDSHAEVRHRDFNFVYAPQSSRVAVQFLVENVEHDGSLTHKSNCNFFDVDQGRFSKIAVYMAGPNTLEAKDT